MALLSGRKPAPKKGYKVVYQKIPVWRRKILRMKAKDLRKRLAGKGIRVREISAGAAYLAATAAGVVTSIAAENQTAKKIGTSLTLASIIFSVPTTIALWRKRAKESKAAEQRRASEKTIYEMRNKVFPQNPSKVREEFNKIRAHLKLKDIQKGKLSEKLFFMHNLNPGYTEKAVEEAWKTYFENKNRPDKYAQKLANIAWGIACAAENAGIKVNKKRGHVSKPVKNMISSKEFKSEINKSANPEGTLISTYLTWQGIQDMKKLPKNVLRIK